LHTIHIGKHIWATLIICLKNKSIRLLFYLRPLKNTLKMKSIKWLIISLGILAILAFAFPIHLAETFKGYYIILGALVPLYFLYLAFKNADDILCLFKATERNKEPLLSGFKKFVLAFLLIVFMGVLGGLTYYRVNNSLKADGIIGNAIITDGAKTTVKKVASSEQSFSADFTFITKDGVKIDASENVSEEEYKNLFVDMPVEIIYLPKHPNVVRLLLSAEDKAEYKK
jgi:hypothetical protein